MRRIPVSLRVLQLGLLLAIGVSSAAAQTTGAPAISERQFVSGSAKVTVSGSTQMDQEVALNTKASYADGGMTWLQFGASGSEAPNATVTYGETGEIGVTIGRGKFVATGGIIPGEPSPCSGKADVTATSIVGEYSCVGVTSHDPASGKLGKVDIRIRFTAKS